MIQADGGTRTAAVTGGWVALALAIRRLAAPRQLTGDPLRLAVAAVSTGIVAGEAAAGPGLRGGLGRRHRLQLRHHRHRQVRRDPGHRRGRAVLARGLRAAGGAGAARGAASCSPCSRTRWRRAQDPRDRSCSPAATATRCARSRRLLRAGVGLELVGIDERGRRAAADRGRADLRGQRPGQGAPGGARRPACPPWPTIRGWRSTPWGARPGVRSARYAGRALRRRPQQRQAAGGAGGRARRASAAARYRCVAAFVDPATAGASCRSGSCEGRVLEAPRGDGGFGYDPLFLIPALGQTMAEIDPAVKNRLSHRAAAFRALAAALSRGR